MRALRLVLVGLVVTVAVGCGDQKGTVVSGKVTKNGSPIKLGVGEGVTLTLTDGGTTFTANAGEDGNFSVQQPAGGPIPYGTYKVHYVHYQSPSPYTKTKGYRVEKTLPDQWEVSPTSSTFAIELPPK